MKNLGINSKVLEALGEIGFEKFTAIQAQSIPELMKGDRDFIGLAQTGTGKTAAFGVPLLHLVDFDFVQVQALILAPTRELCVQIGKDLENYSKYLSNVKILSVYGGASIENNISKLNKGIHIVVATPGRLNDLIRRKKINLKGTKYVVLDEADEMLNMGFKEDIDSILEQTPSERFTWLFAATMPEEIMQITKKYMKEPFELTIGRKNSGAENIEHLFYVVHERDRYSALKRIVDANPDIFAIVFCRTKNETQEIAEKLIKDGYNADSLHGDLSQAQRDKVMKHYREKALQLLVATDVAARGIDVNNVSHVINYQLPDEPEIYTHRSGRTARAGKSGITISLTNSKENYRIRQIERQINKKLIYAKVPTGVEVCEQQLLALMKKILNVEINHKGISKYLPSIFEEFKDLSKDDLIIKMVSLEFNRFLEYYRNAMDLNVDIAGKDHVRRGSSNEKSMFINLGTMDGFDNNSMQDYLREVTNLPKEAFLRINIKGVYSFIDIDNKYIDKAVEAFKNEVYQGRKIRVDSQDRAKSERRKAKGEERKPSETRKVKRDKGRKDREERRVERRKRGERRSRRER